MRPVAIISLLTVVLLAGCTAGFPLLENTNANSNSDDNSNSAPGGNGNFGDIPDANANENSEPPVPPSEAIVDAGTDQIVVADQGVALLATVRGPIPISVTWAPDPQNPIEPFDFVDQGGGLATFTTPTLLNFTFNLVFTVTATYSNGSSLSDSVTITIFGG